MLKIEVKEKVIKESFPFVIKAGYCSLVWLLNYKRPMFYTYSRTLGWKSDIYVISDSVAISTGYMPIGNINVNADILQSYNEQAKKIIMDGPLDGKSEKDIKKAINQLLNIFVKEVTLK